MKSVGLPEISEPSGRYIFIDINRYFIACDRFSQSKMQNCSEYNQAQKGQTAV